MSGAGCDNMQTENSMENQTPYLALASLIGFFLDLFRHFPKNIIDFCYRLLCAIGGFFIFAPFVADGCTFMSNSAGWLGFLNAEQGRSARLVVYCICVMFAEPTVTFLGMLLEYDLPALFRRKLKDGSSKTKTNERPGRERETDSGSE